MLQRHIKIAAIILLFTLALTVLGIAQNTQNRYMQIRGDYFFEKTRDAADVASVVLSFPDNHSVTIEKKESYWKIPEADDYYASFAKVNALTLLIRNSLIYRADVQKSADGNLFSEGITITSKAQNGDVIDTAVIAPRTAENRHHYALLNNNGLLYQITGDFRLSPSPADWIQQPLFNWTDKQVKRIKTSNFDVFRRFPADEFRKLNTKEEFSQIHGLISNFRYLSAEDVTHISNFELRKYQKIKHYDFVLFSGLIYQIDIYRNAEEYRMSVRLTKDKLATDEAVKTLKENEMLFRGWFFRINSDKGQIISDFVL